MVSRAGKCLTCARLGFNEYVYNHGLDERRYPFLDSSLGSHDCSDWAVQLSKNAEAQRSILRPITSAIPRNNWPRVLEGSETTVGFPQSASLQMFA